MPKHVVPFDNGRPPRLNPYHPLGHLWRRELMAAIHRHYLTRPEFDAALADGSLDGEYKDFLADFPDSTPPPVKKKSEHVLGLRRAERLEKNTQAIVSRELPVAAAPATLLWLVHASKASGSTSARETINSFLKSNSVGHMLVVTATTGLADILDDPDTRLVVLPLLDTAYPKKFARVGTLQIGLEWAQASGYTQIIHVAEGTQFLQRIDDVRLRSLFREQRSDGFRARTPSYACIYVQGSDEVLDFRITGYNLPCGGDLVLKNFLARYATRAYLRDDQPDEAYQLQAALESLPKVAAIDLALHIQDHAQVYSGSAFGLYLQPPAH